MSTRPIVFDSTPGSSTVDAISVGAAALGNANTIITSINPSIMGNANNVTSSDESVTIGGSNLISGSANAAIFGSYGSSIISSPGSMVLGGTYQTINTATGTKTKIANNYIEFPNCYNLRVNLSGSATTTPSTITLPASAGVPTGTVDFNGVAIPEGSMCWDSVGNRTYVFNGTTWDIMGIGGAETLAATLAAGNTTGANDVVVSSGQQITYSAGVQIGVGGATTGTTSATGINIGDATTVSNGIKTIAIGSNATTSTAGGIAIGERATVLAGVAIGSVAQATGTNAVCIGQQSTTGTGTGNTVVGHLSRLGDLNTNCIALGFTALSFTSCANTILIGDNCGTGATSTTNLISIGTQNNVQNSQSVKIGRGLGGTGANNSAVGDSIVLTGTANNCSVLGAANTIPTAVTGATVVGSTHTITGTPNNLVCVGYTNTVSGVDGVAVGRGVTMSATDAVAVGRGSSSTAASAVSVGPTATSNGASSVAIGSGSNSGLGPSNIAIGNTAILTGTAASTNNIVIGANITLANNVADRIVIGRGANGTVADNISIGRAASSSGTGSLAIGTSTTSSGTNGVALGTSAICQSASGVAIGGSASAGSGASNTVIGQNSIMVTTSTNSVIVGQGSQFTTSPSSGCIIVGQGSTISAGATDCVIIGRGSTITSARTNTLCLGSGILGANVTVDNTIYLRTGLATAAAAVNMSYDTVTGRLFPVTSSIRYKQNVLPFDVDSNKILSISPKIYNFKKDHCGCGCEDCDGTTCGRAEVGFIAEDMEKIVPEICSYSKDVDGNKQVESIQYDRLVLLLIPILKAHDEEIKALRAEIEALKAK